MSKPVIIRDKFTKAAFHVYTPDIDDNWIRWTLGNPASAFTSNFPIQQVMYGKVYEGKTQIGSNVTGGEGPSAVSAGWTLAEIEEWQYTIRNNDNPTASTYMEWTIPAGHNRISFIYYRLVDGGEVNFSLDGDTEGLDITTFDTSGAVSVAEEVVIATNASDGTTRQLRVNNVQSGGGLDTAIIGIRSFNTSVIGDPSIEVSNISTGHDIIAPVNNGGRRISIDCTPVAGFSTEAMYLNTCEMTIHWRPDGEAASKWTAYGGHYSGSDAPFTVTTNPEMWIDGVDIGDMTSLITFPLGYSNTGDQITAIVEGKGVWDVGVNEELTARISQDFTQAGVAIAVNVAWTGAAEVDGGESYVPSLLIPDTDSGFIQLPADLTQTAIGTDYSGLIGNTVIYTPDNKSFNIVGSSLGPILEVKEQGGSNKLYMVVSDALLPGTTFDTDHYEIAIGSNWALGGIVRISKKGSAGGSLVATDNNDMFNGDLNDAFGKSNNEAFNE